MLRDLEVAMDQFRRCVERRNRELAEAVLDDDYALVLVQPAAVTMHRDRWLEVLDDYIVHEYDVEEVVIDVQGETAAVLHRDRMTATVLGEDRSGTFVISDVWRCGSDGWKIWRRHSTPLSAGGMPGA